MPHNDLGGKPPSLSKIEAYNLVADQVPGPPLASDVQLTPGAMRQKNHITAYDRADASGFSLIELLIVVAIILIIAAIAIPNMLRARISANEASAASSVRTISRAEVSYYAAYPSDGYAASLTVLGGPDANCQPSDTQACLIDSSLTSGQKSGYNFQATGVLPVGGLNSAFVVGATPVSFNKSGVRDFCAFDDGVVRGQAGVGGEVPVTTIAACSPFLPID
jgi:prepilin-type N-terminal cleavage/methylation domain-containing protein